MLISIDALDEEPHVARYYRRLASFARVIHFDPPRHRPVGPARSGPAEHGRRGGATTRSRCSMPPAREQAAVVAWSGAGPIAHRARGAASRPRVCARARRLLRPPRRRRRLPEGVPPELIEGFLRDNPDPDDAVGASTAPTTSTLLAPSMAGDVRFREWMQRRLEPEREPGERACVPDDDDWRRRPRRCSRRSGRRRSCCTATSNRFTPRRLGRYLADAHPGRQVRRGARAPTTCRGAATPTSMLDEIEEFLTGQRHGSADRVLTTVLFTDIVDSTRRAAELGRRGVARRARRARRDRARAARPLRRARGEHDRATASSRRSMRRPRRCGARSRSSRRHAVGGLRVARRRPHRRVRAARRRPRRPRRAHRGAGRVPTPAPARCSSRARSATSSPAPGLALESRGEFELKGVPQRWELFAVQP